MIACNYHFSKTATVTADVVPGSFSTLSLREEPLGLSDLNLFFERDTPPALIEAAAAALNAALAAQPSLVARAAYLASQVQEAA
jgi:hypothetical protein